MAMLPANQAQFEFEGGPYKNGELGVVRFRGREALSQLFSFEIELASREPVDTKKLLGADAQLVIHLPDGGKRFVHGMLRRVELERQRRESGRRYRVFLAPALWKLGLTRHSRIFQRKTAQDIVKKILDDAKIAHEWSVKAPPSRDFCVQYRESDLAFVSRLLEFEGIFYFFNHASGRHTMILGDAQKAHKTIAGTAGVPFRDVSLVSDDESIRTAALGHQLVSSAAALRDFDFKHPKLDLSARKAESDDLEVYDYPGGYVDAGVGKQLAERRLQELRRDAETLAGTSDCRRLTAGFTFTLEHHADKSFNRKLLLTAVEHEGRQPQALEEEAAAPKEDDYHNRFHCMDAAVPFRPPHVTPRPIVRGVQTAVVVGPAGEEIYTDDRGHGRIKIQFHWDREGKKDQQSSCWVRVSQAWAGAHWGALYLPRIGHEVVVRFLEGNPDLPLVVGSVYNGRNRPPIALPGEKTKSTLRSSSSKGGNGSNELQFEDKAGSEQVTLHAQKDDKIAVENDKTQGVGGNESLAVAKNRTRSIKANQFLTVGLDDDSGITGNQNLSVGVNRSTKVGGDHEETVTANETVSIGRTESLSVSIAKTELVGAAKLLAIGAGYSVDVVVAEAEVVGGLRSTQIGGLKFEKVEMFRREFIKGTRKSRSLAGSLQYEVKGNAMVGVGRDFKEKFDGQGMIESGAPFRTKANEIDIKADELGICVGDQLRLLINKSGTVKIWGEQITIHSDSNTKIKGAKVKLKPGDSSSSKAFQEVLDPAEADTVEKYNSPDEAPLADGDKSAFKGPVYQKVLKKDVTVKRLYGGIAKKEGRWVTRGGRPPGLEGKIRMALKPEWGNDASQVGTLVLKKGSVVFEGQVAAQGAMGGGAKQILIRSAPKG